MTGGLLALLMFWQYGADKSAVLALLIAMVLLTIALLDWDTLRIPNVLIAVFAVLAVISPWFFLGAVLKVRLIGIFSISVPMLLANLIRRDCFGGGDIKLMAVAGFLLGWPETILAAFIAVLLGGAAALIRYFRKEMPEKMAFGPWLCSGILISLIWGKEILIWYFSVLGL